MFFHLFFTCFSPLRLGNRGRFLLLSCQDPGLLALAGPGAGPRRAAGGPGAARVDHGGTLGAVGAVRIDP